MEPKFIGTSEDAARMGIRCFNCGYSGKVIRFGALFPTKRTQIIYLCSACLLKGAARLEKGGGVEFDPLAWARAEQDSMAAVLVELEAEVASLRARLKRAISGLRNLRR